LTFIFTNTANYKLVSFFLNFNNFRFLDVGKTIRIVSPPAMDFRHPWKRLNEVLFQLGLRQVATPPLCVIFEFDERDALINYDKYVRLKHS